MENKVIDKSLATVGTQECTFNGMVLNGFLMLFVTIALALANIYAGIKWIILLTDTDGANGGWQLLCCAVLLIVSIVLMCGFLMLEPNEARVLTFFGKYRGTFTRTGYFWVNPLLSSKKVSLRARNLDAEPIKVNDKTGNPVMIGLVLVWKLKDTYKALFEVDTQTMAANPAAIGSVCLR